MHFDDILGKAGLMQLNLNIMHRGLMKMCGQPALSVEVCENVRIASAIR